jgi:hypothetical protein
MTAGAGGSDGVGEIICDFSSLQTKLTREPRHGPRLIAQYCQQVFPEHNQG